MTRTLLGSFSSVAVLVFVLGLIVVWNRNPASTSSPATGTNKTSELDRSSPTKPNYTGMLTDAGWLRETAEAVVALNAEWFEIQAGENRNDLKRQLKLLAELGKHPSLQRFIAEHPETAGLLAASDDPEQIAAGLDSANDDYQLIAGLYVQHAAPGDASEVSAALARSRELIVALQRRGLIGCEVLFLFDRQSPSAEDYEAWLREVLEAKSAASDVEFASFVNLVMRHGRVIRQRLRDDESFRSRFRSELWPRLHRAVGGDHGTFELYLDEDRIWNLVALDNGEELLKRCGLLPIDLLFGYPEIDHPAYPQPLHDKIIQILLRREDRTIHALMKFRGEPLFHQLLARDLSSDTLSAALTQLFNAGPNYPERLALYARLNNTALADEVGPPASGIITWVPFYYTVYEVPKKLLQGRDPTGMDLFSAAVDPIFLFVDVVSAGGTAVSRKALLIGGREVTEVAARKLTDKVGEKLFVTTLRDTGLELARKQVGKEVSEKMADRELLNWTITGTLSEMQQAVRSAVGKATTFEITRPVQFMFQCSRMGRETSEQFTGLEARLFMRGDAKVYVRLTNVAGAVVGSQRAAFFERTAQDLALGTAFESEPGQAIVHESVRQTISTQEQLRAWQHNISAWWLLNASHDATNSNIRAEAQ